MIKTIQALFIFSILLIGKFRYGAAADDDKYTTKYDDLDVDAIIKSPRILKNYMDCVLKGEKCTADGKELSKNIPDAIQTDCSKCSEKQKTMTDQILQHLIDNEKAYWTQLQDKYDPEGSYSKKYLNSQKTK